MKHYLFLTTFVLLFASISLGQQKQKDKLRAIVTKGKMDKAEEYFDKVTDGLSDKKKQPFHIILAKGYYNKKMYNEAAEHVLKSNDKKLAYKIAARLEGGDEVLAAEVYKKAEKFDKAAELFFKNDEYKAAAECSNSPEKNKEYGNQLFDKGKIKESLYFYTKAKKQGEQFKIAKVLDYLYGKKDYNTLYKVQNYNENGFSMNVQGTVFDKMVENNESVEFMKKFMSDKHIYENKQDEVIVAAYADNKMFDKMEQYCSKLSKVKQKVTYSFIANNEQKRNPAVSAWANSKIGQQLLVNDLLGTFLIDEAKSCLEKSANNSANQKLVTEFIGKTKGKVEKCSVKYCSTVKYARSRIFNKSKDLKESNQDLSDEALKISQFLDAVLKKCK